MPDKAHYKRQLADQGVAHASGQDTAHALLHSIRHQGGNNRQAEHGPDRAPTVAKAGTSECILSES